MLEKEEKESDTALRFLEDESASLNRDSSDLQTQKDEARRRVEDKHRKALEELSPVVDTLKSRRCVALLSLLLVCKCSPVTRALISCAEQIDELRKDIQSKTDAIRSEIKESQSTLISINLSIVTRS